MSDVLCLLAALLIGYVVRFDFTPLRFEWIATLVAGPLVWLGVFHAFRLYVPQHLSSWEHFKNVISAVSVGIVVVVTLSFWTHSEISRGWLALTWVLAIVLELATRRVFVLRMARARRDGRLTMRTLIIGANQEAGQLAETLRAPHLGMRPLGYLAVDTSAATANSIPVLGHIDHLEQAIRDHDVECLFVASTAVGEKEMLRVAQVARKANVDVTVSANVPQMLTSRVTVHPVGDVMSLWMKPVRLTPLQTALKRGFDVLVSMILLVVALPVSIAVVVAIKATSRGPILFKQDRVTKDGRVFSMLKFRTMIDGGDDLLREYGVDPTSPFFKLKADPRLTSVGRHLRRLSLDELPQLVNVIKGDMTLVGPRPLPLNQVEANLEELSARHEVQSGVTGWWQIQGRSDLSPEEAIRMDLFYIENWSLSLDLYILLKTLGAMAARAGAY